MFAALDATLQLEVYGNAFTVADAVPPTAIDSNFYLWQTINYEGFAAGRFYQESDGTVEIELTVRDIAVPTLIVGVPTAPQIYTNGGIQTRDAVPNLTSIIVAGRRLWGISTDNPERLYYSGFIDDFEQITWNNTNFVTNPGRPIVALAALDAQVVAFTDEGISRVVGQGPNNLGLGPGFVLQDIVTDTGCTNGAGVVTTDAGVFFPGRRGLYLLPRSNAAPQFVGGPVEDSLDVSAIRQAVVHEQRQVVIWAVGSTWFVYHYKVGVWGTWTGTDIRTPRSMVVWQNRLAYLDDLNDLYIENPAQYATNLVVETAEIKLAGLRGFRRLKEVVLHGKAVGDTSVGDSVSFSMAHDYETGFDDAAVLTGPQLRADARFSKRHKPKQQKAAASRIRVTAMTNDNLTDYFLSGFTLSVQSKGTEQKKSRASS